MHGDQQTSREECSRWCSKALGQFSLPLTSHAVSSGQWFISQKPWGNGAVCVCVCRLLCDLKEVSFQFSQVCVQNMAHRFLLFGVTITEPSKEPLRCAEAPSSALWGCFFLLSPSQYIIWTLLKQTS